MTSLVGSTGFVGSNLMEYGAFTDVYHSSNITDAYGSNPDLLVYAGVRAEKYLANREPQKDEAIVKEAFANIKKISPKRLVLISTIDVYQNPVKVLEDTYVDTSNLQPYGLNRYHLEKWVEQEYPNALIVRLPALYGKNIKKNFIYDLLSVVPSLLKEEKYLELYHRNQTIEAYYQKEENGFYQCRNLLPMEKETAKQYFNKIGFTALNFTDSRGIFQFYNLKYLWSHLLTALELPIKKLNLATEPITIQEIYQKIRGTDFQNECAAQVPHYDMRTRYAAFFGGVNGYFFSKEEILNDLKQFIVEQESLAEVK